MLEANRDLRGDRALTEAKFMPVCNRHSFALNYAIAEKMFFSSDFIYSEWVACGASSISELAWWDWRLCLSACE